MILTGEAQSTINIFLPLFYVLHTADLIEDTKI
jgi:hypothetical protein